MKIYRLRHPCASVLGERAAAAEVCPHTAPEEHPDATVSPSTYFILRTQAAPMRFEVCRLSATGPRQKRIHGLR
jgi:hypothetical protein